MWLQALHIEDAEGTVVDTCSFPAAGGNALLVNGYARNTTIRESEFTHAGDSAIVTLGYADKQDGTKGRQPRGTVVEGCVMSDAGVYGKQSAGFSSALAMETTLRKNIAYNLPRSGFNFNDHFGGANTITNNLIFNTVVQKRLS